MAFEQSFTVEQQCRSCGGEVLPDILFLGVSPLADRLLTIDTLKINELKIPLTLRVCQRCSLAQIAETVEPDILFCSDYPYFSSISKALLAHFRNSAENLIIERRLDSQSLVVEAASNDGYMLQYFIDRDIPVIGIDPSGAPVLAAIDKGVPTRNTFFSLAYAKQLSEEFPAGCDLFLANNVLAHVADLNGFVEGFSLLLSNKGVAVIEVPYLIDLVANCEFDTIYHQHLCYFSVTALVPLFERHHLSLNKVERLSIHGGSIRLYVEKIVNIDSSIGEILTMEKRLGVGNLAYYKQFSNKIDCFKTELKSLLESFKAEGKTIAGYGAAAKACTLLGYFEIGADIVDFIADKNAFKQGRYMGGNKIPIVADTEVVKRMPDYLLILAWNFADEIMNQQQVFKDQGGHFIVPLPQLKVV